MKKILITILCLFALLGCKSGFNTAPISNIEDKASPNALMTQSRMLQCIKLGAVDMGWVVKEIKPGLVEATLVNRGHTAVVSIPYTAQKYSILYKSSSAGLYAEDGNIHKIYNTWVHNLDKQINKYLVRDF